VAMVLGMKKQLKHAWLAPANAPGRLAAPLDRVAACNTESQCCFKSVPTYALETHDTAACSRTAAQVNPACSRAAMLHPSAYSTRWPAATFAAPAPPLSAAERAPGLKPAQDRGFGRFRHPETTGCRCPSIRYCPPCQSGSDSAQGWTPFADTSQSGAAATFLQTWMPCLRLVPLLAQLLSQLLAQIPVQVLALVPALALLPTIISLPVCPFLAQAH
jgi:hypothetical protein